jgi:hypothetical protein
MSTLDQARETQLKNIQTKTGKSLAELTDLIQSSGLTKHGEIRDMLIREFGLGYGDATMLVHFALQSDGQSAAQATGASTDEVLDEIYSGAKADLRPIHDRLMAMLNQFGEFEVVPKKGYVSLRRKRQFAMIGPATKTRVEVGINSKTLEATDRLIAMPPGGMCQFKVNVTDASQVDTELIAWIKQAFDGAG